jgi:hypothetical protein
MRSANYLRRSDSICRWDTSLPIYIVRTVIRDVQEVGGGRGDWMELAQDTDRWRVLVSTVKNLRVP